MYVYTDRQTYIIIIVKVIDRTVWRWSKPNAVCKPVRDCGDWGGRYGMVRYGYVWSSMVWIRRDIRPSHSPAGWQTDICSTTMRINKFSGTWSIIGLTHLPWLWIFLEHRVMIESVVLLPDPVPFPTSTVHHHQLAPLFWLAGFRFFFGSHRWISKW